VGQFRRLSPDGRFLALANTSSFLVRGERKELQGFATREEVRLADVADGTVFYRFTGHSGPVGELRFAPDGRTLASAGHDTTILLWDLTGHRPPPPPGARAKNLKADDLAALWTALGGEAKAAYAAMIQLSASSAVALPLLSKHVQPVPESDKQQMAALLTKVASDKFGDREEATRQLKQLGAAAEPGLRKAMNGNPPLEVQRRLELLLEALLRERPRTARAVEFLERVGDKEARDFLRRLANGAAGAWLTEDARASLRRLEQ
jgi:hypothetical protein